MCSLEKYICEYASGNDTVQTESYCNIIKLRETLDNYLVPICTYTSGNNLSN